MEAFGEILGQLTGLLWLGALAATPLAVLAALICRTGRLGPSTRHALWVMVLASFVTPGVMRVAGVEFSFPAAVADGPAADLARGTLGGLGLEDDGSGGWDEGDALGWEFAGAPVWEPAWELAGEPSPVTNSGPAWIDEPIEPEPVWRDEAREASADDPIGEDSPNATAGLEEPRAAKEPEAAPAHGADPGAVDAWLAEAGASAARVRDAVASVPALPTPIWLGGIAALLLIKALRCARFRYLLARAAPVDEATLRLVLRVSREMGLRRAPRAVIFPKAISPLIWCGLRPVLVLPERLWEELDRGARRAVLMHELAHLKRRDHVVMWAAQCVGALYWWHPVAWWVRRRIDEEADLACDAWVTALRPVSRRAYAETLLMARSFVSTPGAPGLAMASSRTRRFARRLKMVMTENASPRLSMLGVALAGGIALAGAVVTPALACPEKEKVALVSEEAPLALLSGGIAGVAPEMALLAENVAGSERVSNSTFETFMEGQPDDERRELLERLRRLEAELEAIKAYVGEAHGRGAGRAHDADRVRVLAERERVASTRARAEARRAVERLRARPGPGRAL